MKITAHILLLLSEEDSNYC